METLLWVLVPLLILTLLFFWLQSVRKKNATQMAAAITPERAREASAALTAKQHQEVYKQIAMGQLIPAAQAYHNATKASYKDSIIAVQALSKYPQEFRLEDQLGDFEESYEVPSDLSGLEGLPSNPLDPERRRHDGDSAPEDGSKA
ncbi:hypothetical protein [Neomicrococcus lactis]|uniref:Uncharacterized protein n=1 Tax=Neomicrococcus lactis TaxID=732241 RepID=A0A7W8YBN1_9MICC|nr:hypothetical protein [Neomicrococcus lactis]MBB5598487.1 hypothetical protein [Neomicrococcus lactis]